MALNFLNNGYFAGKVGIGTESPQAQLTLLTTMASSPTTQIYLDVDGNNAVGGGCEIIFNTSATGGTLANYNAKITGTRSSANDGSSDLSFFTTLVASANSPAVRMTIKDNGNVGIGTTTPGAKLDVESSTTPLHLNRTGGATALIGLDIAGTNRGLIGATTTAAFVSYSTAAAPLVTVANSGGVQFNTYGAGTLVTDASGNITVSSGGGVGGPYLPLAGGTMTGSIDFVNNKDISMTDNAGAVTRVMVLNASNTMYIGPVDTYGGGSILYGVAAGVSFQRFFTGASERLRINSNGNIAIGTTGSSYRLQVEQDNDGNLLSRFHNTAANGQGLLIRAGGVSSANRILQLASENDTKVMTVNSNGNVGIGTASPAGLLHVSSGTSGDAVVIIESDTDNNDENDNPQLQFKQDGGNTIAKIGLSGDAGTIFTSSLANTAYFGNDEAASVQLYTNATARLTIESGGDVGIGTTNPGAQFNVQGTSTIGWSNLANARILSGTVNAGIGIDSNEIVSKGESLYIGTITSGTDIVMRAGGATSRLQISGTNGNVGIGTTSPDSKLDIEDSNPFVTIQGSSSSYANAGIQFITNHASSARALGAFYYNANTDVEWFSGLPYSGNDAFVINRNTNYTVPSSQSSPAGIGASAGTLFKINAAGSVLFNNYNLTNKIGTPTYILGTDASGNVVKVLGGDIPGGGGTVTGTGTAGTVTKWNSAGTGIENGPITFSGNNSTFAGEITATNIYAETYRSSRTDGEIYIQAATASDFVSIGTQVANNLMRIEGGGNVGIGTTNPQDRLHVKNSDASGSNSRCDIRLENGLGYAEFGVLSNYARIQSNGTEVAALSGSLSLFYGSNWTFGSNLTTVATDGKLTINSGNGTGGEAYLNLSRNNVSGFILNHTATAIQVRATANIPMFFYTNDTIGIKLNANSTISLPEYGAGYLKTDGSGNVTADATVPGTGTFLPLIGGTLSGPGNLTVGGTTNLSSTLTVGADADGHDVLFYGNATGEYMQWDESTSALNIRHDTDDSGLNVFTVSSASMTQPQLRVGRDSNQYWGVYTDDRNAHLVHRQDETTGTMTTRFDQWDSNTSDNTGEWLWRSGNGTGGGMANALTLTQAGDATFAGKVRANNWFQGADGTNTLYSTASTGVLLQTAGSTANNNNSKIYFRNHGTQIKQTFDTNSGDAIFVGKGFSAATSTGDASSTLTTKGYVDGLITGATIYRGTWQAGISATSTGATSSSTTLTVSAAILDTAGNTPTLVGAVVTGAGITGTVKVASVTSSTVYVLDTAISATASAYIFSPIYGAPDLSGVTQTSGYYYICSEAGNATPNGASTEPNTWSVGDWVIWNDDIGSGEWQKVDNSSVLSGVGTGQTVALWEGPSSVTDSETLGNAPITVSGSNTTFASQVIINQPADNLGLQINGYDDEASSTIQLKMDAAGHARLSQTTDGSSGYLFLQAENYLQLIAGTFIYTTSTFRVYDNTQLQFGNSGDYKLYHSTTADTLYIHTNDNKGITIDNAGNTTLTEDVTVGDELTISTITNSSSDTDKFLVSNGGQVQYRTGAEVLSDIGAAPAGPGGVGYLPLSAGSSYPLTGGLYIPSYIYHTGDENTLFGFAGQDIFIVNTGGGRRLTVTNTEATFENNLIVDGNVGIGVTNPTFGLTLSRNSDASGLNSGVLLGLESSDLALSAGYRMKSEDTNSNAQYYQVLYDGDQIKWKNWTGSAYAEKMSLTNSGNLKAAGSIQMADDTATASAAKVGTMRYRTGTEYVDVTGTELVVNGSFAADTDWNKNANWTISGGTANADGTSNNDINQADNLPTAGSVYRIRYEITASTQGQVRIAYGGAVTDFVSAINQYEYIVTAVSTDRVRVQCANSFIGSVDNLSIVEVTAEDASYADMCMQTGAATYEWVNIVRNTY